MDPAVVVVRGRPAGAGRARPGCAGPLLMLLCSSAFAVLLLLGAAQPPSSSAAGRAGARRTELRRTQLRLRSANLVIKDLASEWDEANFHEQPFDFCGKKHMTTRQVRVCADYFLGSLRDTAGDGTKATSVLNGIPKLEPYDKCMMAPTYYMIKACVREVTRALTPAEMVHQSRSGSTGEDRELDAVGMHAIATAQPDASLEGLDGGMNGKVRGLTRLGPSALVRPAPCLAALGWIARLMRARPHAGCRDVGEQVSPKGRCAAPR